LQLVSATLTSATSFNVVVCIAWLLRLIVIQETAGPNPARQPKIFPPMLQPAERSNLKFERCRFKKWTFYEEVHVDHSLNSTKAKLMKISMLTMSLRIMLMLKTISFEKKM
jgi:hypothetical protein